MRRDAETGTVAAIVGLAQLQRAQTIGVASVAKRMLVLVAVCSLRDELQRRRCYLRFFLSFAHLLRCAAAILALTAADILLRLRVALDDPV
jgi:uncharacterized membrane protein